MATSQSSPTSSARPDGTTYSCAGVKNGRVEIIPNDRGNCITPSSSYVAFDGEDFIGDSAKNQAHAQGNCITPSSSYVAFDGEDFIGDSAKNQAHAQRQATKDAVTISSLNVLRIINERTAKTSWLYKRTLCCHGSHVAGIASTNPSACTVFVSVASLHKCVYYLR